MKTRLKAIRKKLGLSQNELTRKANLNSGQVSRIEREIRIPNAETVVKICKALKISSDYFLMLDDYKEEKKD